MANWRDQFKIRVQFFHQVNPDMLSSRRSPPPRCLLSEFHPRCSWELLVAPAVFHFKTCSQTRCNGQINLSLKRCGVLEHSGDRMFCERRDVEKRITTQMGQTIAVSGPTQTRLTRHAGTRRAWAWCRSVRARRRAGGTRPKTTKLGRMISLCEPSPESWSAREPGVHVHPCWRQVCWEINTRKRAQGLRSPVRARREGRVSPLFMLSSVKRRLSRRAPPDVRSREREEDAKMRRQSSRATVARSAPRLPSHTNVGSGHSQRVSVDKKNALLSIGACCAPRGRVAPLATPRRAPRRHPSRVDKRSQQKHLIPHLQQQRKRQRQRQRQRKRQERRHRRRR